MFRITPYAASTKAIFYNRIHSSTLGRLQQQASTGLKFHRPSDDPIDTSRIDTLRKSVNSLGAQQERIAQADRRLNVGITNLVEANLLITRAREISLEAPQTNGLIDRQVLAAEVDKILDRLLAIANTLEGEKYLFSGTATSTEPVDVNDNSALAIPQVSFMGSLERASIVISQSLQVDTHYSGQEIFFHSERSGALVIGNTGAAAGTGTHSEVGRSNLTVTHTLTTYAAGSGIQPGLTSASDDTVIGAMGGHSLTINDTSGSGASGTISLNGGPPVAWTSADTNLEVAGLLGQKVFVDTTAITAGFNGQVNLQSDGTLSVDDNTTTTAINFSGNQRLTNSITGGVTFIDSTGIALTGVDSVEYQGSADIFTALLELKDDLLNTRGLDEVQFAEAFERRQVDLERASNRVLEFVGQQSVASQDLRHLTSHNDNLKLELERGLSDLEAADLSQVIVQMETQQTLLQFNFAAYSVVQSSNLLDFLG